MHPLHLHYRGRGFTSAGPLGLILNLPLQAYAFEHDLQKKKSKSVVSEKEKPDDEDSDMAPDPFIDECEYYASSSEDELIYSDTSDNTNSSNSDEEEFQHGNQNVLTRTGHTIRATAQYGFDVSLLADVYNTRTRIHSAILLECIETLKP